LQQSDCAAASFCLVLGDAQCGVLPPAGDDGEEEVIYSGGVPGRRSGETEERLSCSREWGQHRLEPGALLPPANGVEPWTRIGGLSCAEHGQLATRR
jgi:hypothetical protein